MERNSHALVCLHPRSLCVPLSRCGPFPNSPTSLGIRRHSVFRSHSHAPLVPQVSPHGIGSSPWQLWPLLLILRHQLSQPFPPKDPIFSSAPSLLMTQMDQPTFQKGVRFPEMSSYFVSPQRRVCSQSWLAPHGQVPHEMQGWGPMATFCRAAGTCLVHDIPQLPRLKLGQEVAR